MRQIEPHATVAHLRMFEHLRERIDRSDRNAGRFERSDPRTYGTLLQNVLQQWNQHIAMAHAIRIPSEAVVEVIGTARDLAEPRELSIVTDGDHELTVRRIEHLIWHDVGVRIALPLRDSARHQVVHVHVGEHGDLRVEQSHIDVLTFTSLRSMGERGQHCNDRIQPGREIGDRDTDFLRPTARSIVPLT